MKLKTETVLKILHVMAWIAFIGLLVKGGAMIFSFIMTLFIPVAAENFYEGLNLQPLKTHSGWFYIGSVTLRISIVLLQAYIAFLIIKVLSAISLTSPFTAKVSELLEKISEYILASWLLTLIFNSYSKWLMKRIPDLNDQLLSTEFIFLALVVYLMAQIFKKGIALQSENELTI